MSSLAKCLTVGLLVLPLVGCGTGQRTGWDATVTDDQLAAADLKYYWRQEIDLPGPVRVDRVWRLDENFYALTTANQVVCLDAVTGAYKWTAQVAAPDDRTSDIFPPCHADAVAIGDAGGIAAVLDPPDPTELEPFDAVIFNTISHLLVIDRENGRVKRRHALPFAANTGGSSDGRNVFLGAVSGRYHSVRLVDGLINWTMASGDMIQTAPKVANGRLYVASRDSRLYCIAPYRLQDRHLWRQDTDGPLTANFHVDDRGCFVPGMDYRLYAFDPIVGEELWTFHAQGPLRQAVQVGAKSVYQFAWDDRFYAVDLATGRERWTLPANATVVAAIGNDALVLNDRRELLVIEEATGDVKTSLPMTGLEMFVPNATRPEIYAATAGGKFVCIRPSEAKALTADMLRTP
jgi:outer membrane protein assembly factor BamB